MKRNLYGFVPILILVVVLVATITVAAGYWSRQKQANQPFPFGGNYYKKIPDTKPKDETANWKTYTSQKYNFSLKYPPNWQISEEYSNNPPVLRILPVANLKIEFGNNVSFTIHNDANNLPLDIFLKKIFPGPGLNPSYLSFTVAGIEGKKTSDIPGVNKNEDIFISYSNRIYQLRLSQGYGENISEQTFNQILSTFKFLDQTQNVFTHDLLKNIVNWQVTQNDTGSVFIRDCTDGSKNISPSGKIETLFYGRGQPETIPPVSKILMQVREAVKQNGWQACLNSYNPDGTTPNETYSKNGKLLEIHPHYSMGVGNSITVQFEYD